MGFPWGPGHFSRKSGRAGPETQNATSASRARHRHDATRPAAQARRRRLSATTAALAASRAAKQAATSPAGSAAAAAAAASSAGAQPTS